MRAGGEMWTKEDEEKWDDAIAIALEIVENNPLTTRAGEGDDAMWKLELPVRLTVAKK